MTALEQIREHLDVLANRDLTDEERGHLGAISEWLGDLVTPRPLVDEKAPADA
jgi:rubrerythrin